MTSDGTSLASESSASLTDVRTEKSATAPKPFPPALKPKTIRDYMLLEVLGEGSYSTVHLAVDRETHASFAIKVVSKRQILREKKIDQVFRERNCLQRLSTRENLSPLTIHLFFTFHDADSLYFVLSLASRKDLFGLLKSKKQFSLEQVKFITAELNLALDHIHRLKILHRDIKPENILLSEKGHCILSDFGCAKIMDDEPEPEVPEPPQIELSKIEEVDEAEDSSAPRSRARRTSFVGSAHYVSPEVLNNKRMTPASDYWALGSIVFYILTGIRPFDDVAEYFIFKRITACRYTFPDSLTQPEAKDLITNLLQLDAEKRLTAQGVRNHAFLYGIDWDNIITSPSPLLPL